MNNKRNIDWGEVIKCILILTVCVIFAINVNEYHKRIDIISDEVSILYEISKEDARRIAMKISSNNDIIELDEETAIHKDSGQIYVAEYREGGIYARGITWTPTNEYDYEMLDIIEAIEDSLYKFN